MTATSEPKDYETAAEALDAAREQLEDNGWATIKHDESEGVLVARGELDSIRNFHLSNSDLKENCLFLESVRVGEASRPEKPATDTEVRIETL